MTIITIKQALSLGKDQLAKHHAAEDAMFEAQILLGYILQQERAYLMAWPEKVITENQLIQFESVIQRRLQQEPIAYIVGKREFWSLELAVNQATLIPRPETELLVETALRLLSASSAKVADLGTGSGAIALALATERPTWQITATDISPLALEVAQKNAAHLAIKNVIFSPGIWCNALLDHNYDAIISNPPYIAQRAWPAYASGLAFEPQAALVSGEDGLDDIRVISKQALQYLCAGGFLMLEHGYDQGDKVRAILLVDGYIDVCTMPDLAGCERVTIAKLP